MNVQRMTRIAMIAAIYTAVSLALAPISYGNLQVRIAEALTMLPLIYSPSIAGVTIGCFLTNLIGAISGVNPTGLADSIIGTAATLLAALVTYRFRNNKVKGIPIISILSPVLFNFVFIGAELSYLLMPDQFLLGLLIFGAEVAAGELISVIIGYLFVRVIEKRGILTEEEN